MKTDIKLCGILAMFAALNGMQALYAQEALEANGERIFVNADPGAEYISWVAKEGGQITGENNTVSNSGTVENAGLVYVTGENSKINVEGLEIINGISDKHSIYAGLGGSFTGTSVTASGGANSIYVNQGNVSVKEVDMTSSGYVAWVTDNSYLKLESGKVQGNAGVYVYPGSTFDGTDLAITATGSDGVHLKWGGIANLDNVTINAGANGIQLESYAAGSIIAATDVTINSVLSGVRIAGPVGSASYAEKNGDLKNIKITTTGSSGYGILADQGSTVYIDTAEIKTTGGSSRGIYVALGSQVFLTGEVSIETAGSSAHGIIARYTNHPSGRTTSVIADENSTVTIVTKGGNVLQPSHGVYAGQESSGEYTDKTQNPVDIQLNGKVDITVGGSYSHGMYAYGADASISSNGGTVNVSQSSSVGIFANAGGTLTAKDLDVTSSGGVGAKVSGNSAMTLTDTSITAKTNGVDLAASSTNTTEFSLKGGSIKSDGNVLSVTSGAAGSNVKVDLSNISAEGSKFLNVGSGVNAGTITDINIDASTISGAIDRSSSQANIVLKDTDWQNVGASRVTTLEATGGSMGMHIRGVGDYDSVSASGKISILDSLEVQIWLDSELGDILAGSEFKIFDASEYEFDENIILSFQGKAALIDWDTSRFHSEGVIVVREIPEAAQTAAVAGMLALALGAYRRRKRA